MNDHTLHSVTLDADKCRGCTNCIKRCPTEAIRVRSGKAQIISERCIDCGECIRICPHRAKKAVFGSLDELANFKYNIALPAPALYGQFPEIDDIDFVLAGLLQCGFDSIFEVSRAAEIISDYTRYFISHINAPGQPPVSRPVISSACPAVCRLITVRYPNLADNLLPVLAPVEAAARIAVVEAMKKHPNLAKEDIGVFFLSPCPAKVSYVKNPMGVAKSAVSGVLSIGDIYFKLQAEMKKIQTPPPISRSGIVGVSWAGSGGESSALLSEKYLAADGIENVINVLDKIDNDNFAGLDFIELNACAGGCVGGVLNIENGYIAKARLQKLRKYLPVSQNKASDMNDVWSLTPQDLNWEEPPHINPALKLSDNKARAVKMMIEMERLTESFPQLDCGACGAPTCKALAEDIVRGVNVEDACMVIMKEKLKKLGEFPKWESEGDLR
ncbi:ferredoxin [Clostridia bacterium]|nr:ferredoxin [Clostridia bacterium]